MIRDCVRDTVNDVIKDPIEFNPLDFGVIAWYDASDPGTIQSSGGLVSIWADKSGNGNNATQGTASNQPEYPATLNGLNALQCANARQVVMTTPAYSVKEIISVIYLDSSTPFAFVCGNAGNTQELFFKRTNTVSFDGGGVGANTGAYSINGQDYSSDADNHSDAVIPSTFVGAGKFTSNLDVTRMLGRSGLTINGDCYFGEVVAFDRELTASERTQITNYLRTKWSIPFTPLQLNPEMWLDATDESTITESGNLISLWADKSNNGVDASQATGSLQPTYNVAGYIEFDNVDDFLTYNVGTYTGQIGIATRSGTYVANCSYSGSFNMPLYQPFDIVAIVIADTINQEQFKTYAVTQGAVAEFGGVTNFVNAFRSRTDLTSFPVIDTSSATNLSSAWRGNTGLLTFPLIDTSSVTNLSSTWNGASGLTEFPSIDTSLCQNFSFSWFNCSSLTIFPLLDTSSALDMSFAWRNCSSLATFPANMFDSTPCTNFTDAFSNTVLTETSIDNILVSINTAGTSNGTFDQSGGSAPSATGEAAITEMWSRGWTVTVTGGFQINPIAWYDASDASTITESGGLVSQWDDKSGNGNNATQATGANQPTTGTRTVGGLNVIDFDGSADFLSLPSGVYNGLGESDNSLFVVYKTDAIATDQRIVTGMVSGPATRYGLIHNATNSLTGINSTSFSAGSIVDLSITSDTDAHIDGIIRNGSNLTTFRDSSENTETKAENVTIISANISSFNGTSAFLDGVICEILIFKRAVTSAERTQITNYLATKWSITL